MAPVPGAPVTTSILLGNLHCPSCVSTIKLLLSEVGQDDIIWVSPNVVTSVVTVQHNDTEKASVPSMTRALQDNGFEVIAITTADPAASKNEPLYLDQLPDMTEDSSGQSSRMHDAITPGSRSPRRSHHNSSQSSTKNRVHLQNCELCRDALQLEKTATIAKLPAKSADFKEDEIATVPRRESMLDRPFASELEGVVGTDAGEPVWRMTLAVGGMTCAVCVNAITEDLSKRPWITNVAVNLVSNSATVDFTDEDNADAVVKAIEDLGYEATIDTVTQLGGREQLVGEERTVEIHIDGIYCPQCPDRLAKTLEGFHQPLRIVTAPTLGNPVLKIAYKPQLPHFTIRHILAAIDATDTAFHADIYHPPTLEERSKLISARHRRQLLVRLIFSIVVAIPCFIIGVVYMGLVSDTDMNRMFLMEPWTSGLSRAQIALFIMATPVYFFGADLFHTRAVKEIMTMWRRGSRTPLLQRFYRFGSMNMLISLGTTIAYVSSLSQMIAAAVQKPKKLEDTNFYFDSVVFLTMFLLAGRLIENYSKSKTGDAVDALGKLRPTTALLVVMDKEGATTDSNTPVDQLESGDIIRVPHGSSPAGDGIIVQGETNFDESSLTGESRLIPKAPGDEIYAGTVNKDGPVLMRVTGIAGKSMLDQIVDAVREGQTKRAPMEQIADLLTSYFVPVITLIAIITWIVWMVVGFTGGVPDHFLDNSSGWVPFALQFAIAVFVVACPCGLALAAPTAIFVGGGLAAKNGILAKGGGEAFETASKVDCVVFDKTGTLTVGGEPKITDSAFYVDETRRDMVLAVLRAVEENSSHPIAKAVVTFCSEQSTSTAQVDQLQEIPGRGMRAVSVPSGEANAFEMLVGNEALMQDFGVAISQEVSAQLDNWKREAKSVALVATRTSPGKESPDAPWGLSVTLAIADAIRTEAVTVIRTLKQRGTLVWMLSGDNTTTARAVAQRVGIDSGNVLAEVLPSQKAEKIKYLQTTLKAGEGKGRKGRSDRRAIVAMVGDGINDSPALTTADVGIAIGSGSDVAISSAGFVLVKSDLRAVVTLLDLSHVVFQRIRVNFGWAVVFNLVAVPVAAGVLYPVTTSGGQHVRLDPVWASLAMALSSISVVMSSLMLRSRLPFLGFRAKEMVIETE